MEGSTMKSLGKILVFTMLLGGAVFAQAQDSAPAAAPETNNKDAVCLKCHSETKPLTLYKTAHGVRGDSRTPFCVDCHGVSAGHLADKKTPPDMVPDTVYKKGGSYAQSEVKNMNTNCLSCHQKDNSRHNWMGSAHQINDVACVNCHSIHTTHDKVREKATQAAVCYTCHKEQRAQMSKISHHPVNEGKMSCSDCHNLHGTSGPKLLKKHTVNETCFTCHTEKRGPFLWEHQPVSENCNNCHNPHGSNITPLLKSRAPFLCQECHDGPHNSAVPYAGNVEAKPGGDRTTVSTKRTLSSSALGRACLNCHSVIHGSNHPAGAILHR
jgi:DmsE family decaheme c-type cytochrome